MSDVLFLHTAADFCKGNDNEMGWCSNARRTTNSDAYAEKI